MNNLTFIAFLLMQFAVCQLLAQGNADPCQELNTEVTQLKKLEQEIVQDPKYQSDRDFQKNYQTAQEAWASFEKAHLQLSFPDQETDEACLCRARLELIQQRKAQVIRWKEGLIAAEPCRGSVQYIKQAPMKVFLVDAEKDQKIQEIKVNDKISLKNIPREDLSIMAVPTGPKDTYLSYKFEIQGAKEWIAVENVAPFCMFGDDQKQDIFGESFSPGKYKLIVTPFTEKKAKGEAGVPAVLPFELID